MAKTFQKSKSRRRFKPYKVFDVRIGDFRIEVMSNTTLEQLLRKLKDGFGIRLVKS